ncbi:MAG TPA: glutaredoxin family protein [Dehalococcoidia bacterium]|nr:glutaredoxin family protein [Dehalococcoidia bacterium]
MNGRAVTLYSRRGCHLCEDAELLLGRLGCDLTVVDVDAEPALQSRYGDEVPVLVMAGQPVLSGILREEAVRAALGSL